MKKRNKLMKLTVLLLIMGMVLAGCGGSSESASVNYKSAEAPAEAIEYEYATDDIYMETVTEEAAAEEAIADESGAGSAESPEVQDTERKLIKTVNMDVETEQFDVLMQTINDKTTTLGGYVEFSNTYNGSHYYGNQKRNANLTLRIPAQNLDDFLETVSETSNVINKSEDVEDVTLQYVDMKSRKDALTTEHDRLLELLEQAETVEDIITIEGRLSEVRYQMESIESQLRTLQNQVSYSTVHLYIEEVVKYTPVKELSFFEKITTGFAESLYDVGNGIVNFIVSFIIHIPYLVVWAVIIVAAVLIFKAIRKGSPKRKAKREEKRAMKEAKKAEKVEKKAEAGGIDKRV